ncbi:putative ATP-dependent DNA helicase YjcD [Lachnospiraceae bacterium]|nr:putative ATP-dependent DNA helicase YjcD [Lachnospiraceae bacterium]
MPDFGQLNETQRKAVTWGEGPLLLLAGPGSGKTFTVTNRILFLLKQGVPPERILVITFTREAALSMQRRFQSMSGQFRPVHFGTFHSVFYRILQESGGFPHLKLLTGSQKRNLILPILQKYDNQPGEDRPGTDPEECAAGVLAAVSCFWNTGEPVQAAEKCPAPWRGSLEKICLEYGGAIRRIGGMDFDHMLFACTRLLEADATVRRRWKNRFSHILIDEFQDINPVQYEAVKLLSASPHNIFAVGDDDQSIYGFRGSRPELMKRFREEFGAGMLLLDVNYRCRQEIVHASLRVIGENQERFPKRLRAAQAGEGQNTDAVKLRAFRDREEETAYLAKQLGDWQEAHRKDGRSCAVLFRTNLYMQAAAARLRNAGIRFGIGERTTSVYLHFIVKDIMAYLLLAAGEWKREHLLRVINRPSRYVSREAVGESRSISGMIRFYEEGSFDGEMRSKVLKRLRLLETQLNRLGKMKPAMAVNYVLKAVKYESYLTERAGGDREKLLEWNELLEWLRADAAGCGSTEEWLERQRCFTKELQSPVTKEGEEVCIRLMTIHGAKGLEFDRVYIPDCNERVIPQGCMQDNGQVEEERRLLYVAMTRAKKSLELLYLSGDRQRPRLPSRFLTPLFQDSSSTISSNSQLSRNSSKASDTLSYSSSSEMNVSSGSWLGSSRFSL